MADLLTNYELPKIVTLAEALRIANNKLIQKYGEPDKDEPAKLICKKNGSSNTVRIYKKKYGEENIKYVVRINKYASFKIVKEFETNQEKVSMLFEYKCSKSKCDEFIYETRQCETNWRLANTINVSPELYFYGYIKAEENMALCIISEAYKMDLCSFYNIYEATIKKNKEIQTNIANQLINIFHEISNKLGMIWYDNKLLNIVINYDLDENKNLILNENFRIKLIDWDADWCIKYNFLKCKDEVARLANQKATSMLMIMIMANNFYEFYEFNIFRNYMIDFFENDKKNKFLIINVMRNLFENKSDEDNKMEFVFMVRHYFQIVLPTLEEMLKRSMSKNSYEYKNWQRLCLFDTT